MSNKKTQVYSLLFTCIFFYHTSPIFSIVPYLKTCLIECHRSDQPLYRSQQRPNTHSIYTSYKNENVIKSNDLSIQSNRLGLSTVFYIKETPLIKSIQFSRTLSQAHLNYNKDDVAIHLNHDDTRNTFSIVTQPISKTDLTLSMDHEQNKKNSPLTSKINYALKIDPVDFLSVNFYDFTKGEYSLLEAHINKNQIDQYHAHYWVHNEGWEIRTKQAPLILSHGQRNISYSPISGDKTNLLELDFPGDEEFYKATFIFDDISLSLKLSQLSSKGQASLYENDNTLSGFIETTIHNDSFILAIENSKKTLPYTLSYESKLLSLNDGRLNKSFSSNIFTKLLTNDIKEFDAYSAEFKHLKLQLNNIFTGIFAIQYSELRTSGTLKEFSKTFFFKNLESEIPLDIIQINYLNLDWTQTVPLNKKLDLSYKLSQIIPLKIKKRSDAIQKDPTADQSSEKKDSTSLKGGTTYTLSLHYRF